jgi:hypothetical protein
MFGLTLLTLCAHLCKEGLVFLLEGRMGTDFARACAVVALLTLTLTGAISSAAAAEFRVNTFQTGDQSSPAIAALSPGGFVVAWSSVGQDGEGFGVYGQRYSATGAKAGGEFRINSFTKNDQLGVAVAGLSGGGFVAVWSSRLQDGDLLGAFGQRYGANGAKAGGEFRVNTVTADDQGDPSVAALANDTFVVTWTSINQDGSGHGVYGQRFAANGAKAGGPFRVNTTTLDNQGSSSVSRFGTNSFVVAWTSRGQDGSGSGVYAQRYSSNGAKIGGEFPVNVVTEGFQHQPAIGRLKNGSFVIVYTSEKGSAEVQVQRYTLAGVKSGGPVRANTYVANDQSTPAIVGTAQGGFVVAWTSNKQDNSLYGVYGQRFTATGAKSGSEFRINETTKFAQIIPSLAPVGNGFVGVWRSDAQDAGGTAVIGRKFAN